MAVRVVENLMNMGMGGAWDEVGGLKVARRPTVVHLC